MLADSRAVLATCCICLAASSARATTTESEAANGTSAGLTLTNPRTSGQDPSVQFDPTTGAYYYALSCGSTDNQLCLRKSTTLTGLDSATNVLVFQGPSSGNHCHEYWAPTLSRINGVWYMYYAADDGTNANHRLFVISNPSTDPTQGTWTDQGQLTESFNQWAIDPAVLVNTDGKLYLFWSSSANGGGQPQYIAIAALSDPLHTSGASAYISAPYNDWEKENANINEQPRPFVRNGKVYVSFNASASWTNNYQVGLLTPTGTNLTCGYSCWHKIGPILSYEQGWANAVYGPGGFQWIPSPDGTEDWVMYHAAVSNNSGWTRNLRIQRLYWDADGTPVPGYPLTAGTPLDLPSGENGTAGWGAAWTGAFASSAFHVSSPTGVDCSVSGCFGNDSTGAPSSWHALYRGDPKLFDFTLDADIFFGAAGTTDPYPKVGVYVAYQDANNYAAVFFDKKNCLVASNAWVNGTAVGWANAGLSGQGCSGGLSASYWNSAHHLRVVKTDSTFQVYVDPATYPGVLQTRTFGLGAGQVAAAVADAQGTFSNFSVTSNQYGWRNAFLIDAGSGAGTKQGSWSLSSAAALSSQSTGAGWMQIFRGNPNFRHFSVEADVTWVSQGAAISGDVPKYGVFACYQSPTNQVVAALDKNYNVLATGVMTGGGAFSWANSANLPIPWVNTHHLKVIKYPWNTNGSTNGSTFEFYLTDVQSTPMLTRYNIPILSCQVGLMTDNTRASYANLKVVNLDN